jgi:hypothetical protein
MVNIQIAPPYTYFSLTEPTSWITYKIRTTTNDSYLFYKFARFCIKIFVLNTTKDRTLHESHHSIFVSSLLSHFSLVRYIFEQFVHIHN